MRMRSWNLSLLAPAYYYGKEADVPVANKPDF